MQALRKSSGSGQLRDLELHESAAFDRCGAFDVFFSVDRFVEHHRYPRGGGDRGVGVPIRLVARLLEELKVVAGLERGGEARAVGPREPLVGVDPQHRAPGVEFADPGEPGEVGVDVPADLDLQGLVPFVDERFDLVGESVEILRVDRTEDRDPHRCLRGCQQRFALQHLDRHLQDADRVRIAGAAFVQNRLRRARIETDESLRERLADTPSAVSRLVGVALDNGGIADASPPAGIMNLPDDGLDRCEGSKPGDVGGVQRDLDPEQLHRCNLHVRLLYPMGGRRRCQSVAC